jgi:hypothetical protein
LSPSDSTAAVETTNRLLNMLGRQCVATHALLTPAEARLQTRVGVLSRVTLTRRKNMNKRSRMKLVLGALLTALGHVTLVNAAHITSEATVPNAAAVGESVPCQPISTTRPQPILPKGFTEQILYKRCLTQPTAMSFNGNKTRVFVAEKGGQDLEL